MPKGVYARGARDGRSAAKRSVKQIAHTRRMGQEQFAHAARDRHRSVPCRFSWWLDTENFYALAKVRADEMPILTADRTFDGKSA